MDGGRTLALRFWILSILAMTAVAANAEEASTQTAQEDAELTETYIGPCGNPSTVTDSDGNEISCYPPDRPVCYSDGTCSCIVYDEQCQ